jgi:hypothetical protein
MIEEVQSLKIQYVPIQKSPYHYVNDVSLGVLLDLYLESVEWHGKHQRKHQSRLW